MTRVAVAVFAVVLLAGGSTLSARGEPMPTLIGFDRGTYDDSEQIRTSNCAGSR